MSQQLSPGPFVWVSIDGDEPRPFVVKRIAQYSRRLGESLRDPNSPESVTVRAGQPLTLNIQCPMTGAHLPRIWVDWLARWLEGGIVPTFPNSDVWYHLQESSLRSMQPSVPTWPAKYYYREPISLRPERVVPQPIPEAVPSEYLRQQRRWMTEQDWVWYEWNTPETNVDTMVCLLGAIEFLGMPEEVSETLSKYIDAYASTDEITEIARRLRTEHPGGVSYQNILNRLSERIRQDIVMYGLPKSARQDVYDDDPYGVWSLQDDTLVHVPSAMIAVALAAGANLQEMLAPLRRDTRLIIESVFVEYGLNRREIPLVTTLLSKQFGTGLRFGGWGVFFVFEAEELQPVHPVGWLAVPANNPTEFADQESYLFLRNESGVIGTALPYNDGGIDPQDWEKDYPDLYIMAPLNLDRSNYYRDQSLMEQILADLGVPSLEILWQGTQPSLTKLIANRGEEDEDDDDEEMEP